MASRQVMRSVSAGFCASAGTAIASVMQVASSAPRSQEFDRIDVVLSIPKRRCRRQEQDEDKQPACQAFTTSSPCRWPPRAICRADALLPGGQIEARQIVLKTFETQ